MNDIKRLDCIGRRAFVRRLAQAAFGVTVAPALSRHVAFAAPARASAKSVIWLQLKGGMSHIDTFDPKEGTSKGPRDAIATSADFRVTAFLPNVAKIADKLCVIRSMTAKVGVHESAQYLMRTGYEQRGTIVHPALGPWFERLLGPSHASLPSSVCVNRNAGHGNGFLPARTSPMPILDPEDGLSHARGLASDAKMTKRLALLRALEADLPLAATDRRAREYGDFYEGALRLMKSADLDAFDLAGEPEAVRDAYGRSRVGQGALLARRLCARGVRLVEVESNGWDHHKELEDGMSEVGAPFDQALAALVRDLGAQGLLASTLVVVSTEFGRSPRPNGSGRGHHPKVFSCVLAGGGVRGGFVHGASDAQGAEPAADPVTVGQLHATVAWALGAPLTEKVESGSGRPFTVGDGAAPLRSLFG